MYNIRHATILYVLYTYAGPRDYSSGNPRFIATATRNAIYQFSLRTDNIAAEDDETLQFELTLLSTPPSPNAFFLNSLTVVIIDSDGELTQISMYCSCWILLVVCF